MKTSDVYVAGVPLKDALRILERVSGDRFERFEDYGDERFVGDFLHTRMVAVDDMADDGHEDFHGFPIHVGCEALKGGSDEERAAVARRLFDAFREAAVSSLLVDDGQTIIDEFKAGSSAEQ